MPSPLADQLLEPKYSDTSLLLENIDGEDFDESNYASSILLSPGLGRHLDLYSTTLLIIGRMIGTGIFSAPSSITNSVGSVGAALLLWALGFALSFCGLFVWFEYGCMFPKSGGEKIYLEAAFPRPRLLATILCAVQVLLLTSCAGSSIVFAENSVLAAHSSSNSNTSDFAKRSIAVMTILSVTSFHSLLPKWAVKVMSLLTMTKILILSFIVLTGFFVLTSGIDSVPDPQASFHNVFAGSSNNSYDYAIALLKVLSTYQGWSTAAYVLNEVKDPVRTLKIAGPLALGTVGILYTFANIAYFAAATPKEISESGVTVAAFFMGKVFGDSARRVAAVFAALSALGNTMSVSFSLSRVDQELAKEGILPFSAFWARSSPYGTPAATLGLVFLTTSLTVVTIPFGDAYNFILDVMSYPTAIVALFVTAGLFILRYRSPKLRRPFKIWLPIAFIFLAAQIFLIVTPFIKPSGGKGDTSLPYWMAPFISLVLLFCGVIYWFVWLVALPRIGGFSWVAEETQLSDGTVLRTWQKSRHKKTGRDVD